MSLRIGSLAMDSGWAAMPERRVVHTGLHGHRFRKASTVVSGGRLVVRGISSMIPRGMEIDTRRYGNRYPEVWKSIVRSIDLDSNTITNSGKGCRLGGFILVAVLLP